MGGDSSKKASIFAVFVLLFLTSCTYREITFTGENNHWYVDYYVQVLDTDSEASHVIIKYIGPKPIPKKVEFKINGPTGSLGGNMPLTKGGVLQSSETRCDGCATTSEDAKFKATITWDGKSETFILVQQ